MKSSLRLGVGPTWMCIFATLVGPGLTARGETHISKNAYVQVSERVVNFLFERQVLDSRFVRETILGTETSGQVETRGRVTAHLLPSANQGLIEVRLSGLADLQNGISQRRAVTIQTSAQTTIDASKILFLDDEGLHPQSATAQCVAAVNIEAISARARIVEGLARRIASRNQSQYEQAAARLAEGRAAEQLDLDCDSILGTANRMFRDKVRAPLLEEGLWPSTWQFQSTAEHLHIHLFGSTASPRGASGRHPSEAGNHDLCISFHESLVHHVVDLTLGGATIHDRQFLELMRVFTGQAPRALWVHDRAPRWHVVFARESPARVVFDDGGFSVTMWLSQIARGDQTFNEPVQVSSRHALEITPDGLRLVRQGDVHVQLGQETSRTADLSEVCAFLHQKLSAVFPSELNFDGLVPPAGASWDQLRRLQLKHLSATEGWLTFGYFLDPEPANMAANR